MHLTLPDDLAEFVRGRLATGEFKSVDAVIRAALTFMASDHAGDDAATIRQSIELGWQQAKAGQSIDGEAAMKRWRERERCFR